MKTRPSNPSKTLIAVFLGLGLIAGVAVGGMVAAFIFAAAPAMPMRFAIGSFVLSSVCWLVLAYILRSTPVDDVRSRAERLG